MVKVYLRYEQKDSIGVITTPQGCIRRAGGNGSGVVATTALETVFEWNLRKGTIERAYTPDAGTGPSRKRVGFVHRFFSILYPCFFFFFFSLSFFFPQLYETTTLATSSDGKKLAVGYSDGTVRVWDRQSRECLLTLTGHSRSITCLTFHEHFLVSGSADTDIIVWDIIAETVGRKLSKAYTGLESIPIGCWYC